MTVLRVWPSVLLMAAALSIASAKPTAGVFWHLYWAVCTSESPPKNWRNYVSFDVCHAGHIPKVQSPFWQTNPCNINRPCHYYREVASDHVSDHLGKDNSKYWVFRWYYQIPPQQWVSELCREGCSTVSLCGCFWVWQLATEKCEVQAQCQGNIGDLMFTFEINFTWTPSVFKLMYAWM